MNAEAIQSLAEDGSDEARDRLLTALATTDDASTRNAAALALSDLGDARVVQSIARLLRDPRTRGARGSLVYALGPFDTRSLARLLMELATAGAFEASREAFALLDGMQGPIDPREHEACERLARSRLAQATDPEQRAWLERVVGLFDDDGEDTT